MASDSQQLLSKRIVGFFPGVWDLLHPGHIRAFYEAKEHCDHLIVGINVKPDNKKPIMTADEREEMIEALHIVDAYFLYRDDKELQEIDLESDFDIRFIGVDHKRRIHHPIKTDIIYISRDHDYSTTAIRERCQERL